MSKKKPSASGLTVQEAGRLGGAAVKKKYGDGFFEAIGRKGGNATKASHGPEFYAEIGLKGGRKGGESTRDKYGAEYYEAIGSKGGQAVKRMIEAGKAALATKADGPAGDAAVNAIDSVPDES